MNKQYEKYPEELFIGNTELLKKEKFLLLELKPYQKLHQRVYP